MPQTLRFRAPGTPLLLREVLGYACPGLEPKVFEAWAREGVIQARGRVARDLDAIVAPGVELAVAIEGKPLSASCWPGLRARGGSAFVLTVTPAVERGAVPSRWDDRVADGVEDRVEVGSGSELQPEGAGEIEFEVVTERDGLCELKLKWGRPPLSASPDGSVEAEAFREARHVLECLARSGLCVIGDALHGGIACAGGPAFRAVDAGSHAEAGAWPTTPLFVSSDTPGERAAWVVSDATARVLGRGHPWIRLDEDTDDPAAFAPGARVDVVTRDGRPQGQALVEGAARSGALALGGGDVAGRVVGVAGGGNEWSIEACVARAVARRGKLLADGLNDPARTNAFRLVHGEADGLPGLHVDRLGGLLRVLVTAHCGRPLVDRVLAALGAGGPRVVPEPWRIVEVVHLDERRVGRFELARVHPYSADPQGAAALGRQCEVREAGLTYRVEPGLGEPQRSAPGFGLFLDQRENRAVFAARARDGGRFLNLFAHTGAFSVAALAAGADEVVSVDLSAAYLRWLDVNLEANADAGVDASQHVAVRQDGRRFLERLGEDERFDGIVLDPPTAAAAGRRFFSVRKDAVPMIALSLTHLASEGRLLVTLNDRKGRRRLEAAIHEAAESVGVVLDSVDPAPPSRDFPLREGFDEGDPFRGFWVQVR